MPVQGNGAGARLHSILHHRIWCVCSRLLDCRYSFPQPVSIVVKEVMSEMTCIYCFDPQMYAKLPYFFVGLSSHLFPHSHRPLLCIASVTVCPLTIVTFSSPSRQQPNIELGANCALLHLGLQNDDESAWSSLQRACFYHTPG